MRSISAQIKIGEDVHARGCANWWKKGFSGIEREETSVLIPRQKKSHDVNSLLLGKRIYHSTQLRGINKERH